MAEQPVRSGKPPGWSNEYWTGWQRARSMQNKSGCCCVFDDDDETILSPCAAHRDWVSPAVRAELEAIVAELNNTAVPVLVRAKIADDRLRRLLEQSR